jgi:septation ring formation regulator EzrA
MASYKYKNKISDDIDDAREIIKNIGRTLQEGKTDLASALTNLAAALEKLNSARYFLDRD